MLNARMIVIIQELMKAETSVTSEYLAKFLDVTSRTIRNDIKELETIVLDFGGSIKSTRGIGYELIIDDDQLFRQLLQNITEKGNENEGVIPTLPEDRVQYILKRLLLAGEYLKLDDIADELYISKSTLQNDLKEIKEIFHQYGITFNKRPNFGFKLVGDEFKLRMCMADHLFNSLEPKGDFDPSNIPIFMEKDLNKISRIILNEINKHQMALSDIGLNNLIIHLAIAYNRIKEKKYITFYPMELADLKKQKKYKVADEIVKALETELVISFPETEVAYITIHLLGTKMLTEFHMNDNNIHGIDHQIYQTVKKMLETIDNELHLKIENDQELFRALCLHLKPALHRLQYGINLTNPLLQDIKSKYPHAFQAAVIAGIVLKQELEMEINENEIGYLALHLGAAMENNKIGHQSKKCIIVCASGVGSARLLANKIKARFGASVDIVGTTEYYKLNQISMHSLDFIISTIPISKEFPLPVIQVNSILGGNDLGKIEKLFSKEVNQKLKYIREELVFLQKNLVSREGVLHFLGGELADRGLVDEQFLESVFAREAISPTSYGKFVAIPHPITPITDSTFWAICTLQKPIKWGDKRVQFVCLLNVEKNSTDELQHMYDHLVDLIDNSQIVQQLIKCKTYKEFATVFLKG
ncbi:BglG family transcription antiterminator [Peribacillus muralis]|uniref:BglG family transcription antiterminator n=1 Tax=Peribacillus muralis TaxID=264697 RepID=UPI00070F8B09|nr:BglG family transcription antiterminator [Peribacillus muralis]